MKTKRQAEILKIIQENQIETQDQLLDELCARGMKSTQATISRDIKELHLVKELSGQSAYRYALSERKASLNIASRLRIILRESVTGIEAAGTIVVVKTMPGLGSAAGAALDSMQIADMVGSLGGDDTVFLAMRNGESAQEFAQELQKSLSRDR